MPRSPSRKDKRPPAAGGSSPATPAVFLDSSSIRALDPNSVVGHLLRDLVRRHQLEFHTSEIVVEEVAGGIADDLRDLGRDAAIAFSWASRSGKVGQSSFDRIRATIRTARDALPAGVSGWLKDMKAVTHEVTTDPVRVALKAYFQGAAPFRARRSREDLPDAMILETVRALMTPRRAWHAMVFDKRLAQAFEALPGMQVHRTWASLLKTQSTEDGAIFRAIAKAKRKQFAALLTGALEKELSHHEIESPAFHSDNEDATIDGTGTLTAIQTIDEDVQRIDDTDAFLVPFRCRGEEFSATLCILKSAFWSMDGDRYTLVDGDWNDHYVLAEVEVDLSIAGTAVVEVKMHDGVPQSIATIEVADLDEVVVDSPAPEW